MRKENFLEKLKNSGLKNTKHRLAILDILESSKQPIPADDIFYIMKKKKKLISLSTIYRALEALVEKELVAKVSFENESRILYEFNKMTHHHYAKCIKCNKIILVEECPLVEFENHLEEKMNFSIVGHKFVVYGYCFECRNE